MPVTISVELFAKLNGKSSLTFMKTFVTMFSEELLLSDIPSLFRNIFFEFCNKYPKILTDLIMGKSEKLHYK